MLRLRYESYKQSTSVKKPSTNLSPVAAYIYDHLRLRDSVSNGCFKDILWMIVGSNTFNIIFMTICKISKKKLFTLEIRDTQ